MLKYYMAAAVLAAAPAAQAATNLLPANWASISWPGAAGVLRDGSPWGPGSTPSDALAPIDESFQPEGTQWNNGSFWWDQDPSVNQGQIDWTITLSKSFTFNRLVLQADDNDSYLIEYWTGDAWASAFAVPAVFSFGLVTRDSGTISPITTDRFRITATSGDNYYAFSEFQAFGVVPEPATWAMLIAGFGLVGMAARKRASAAPAA